MEQVSAKGILNMHRRRLDAQYIFEEKEAGPLAAAKRPVAEKLRVLAKLRDLEKELEPIRAGNKALPLRKGVKIRVKTA